MKRLVKLESLRRQFENQILTPWYMYQWADENIEHIKFFYVSMDEIASHTSIIQNRLTIAETIYGTRSYHCFRSDGKTKLELYILSTDEIFVVKNLHASKGLHNIILGLCIIVVMTKTASFGHPDMIYIMCHSPAVLDLLKCQILLEDMDETVTESVQNLFKLFNQNLSKLLNRKQ